MSFFRRKPRAASDAADDERSYAEIESNPELIAAEAAVNDLPPPPPSSDVVRDVYMGSAPGIVGLPVPEIVEFPVPEEDDEPEKS